MAERLTIPEQRLSAPEHHKALPTPEQAQPLGPGEPDPRQKLVEARQRAAETANANNPLEALKAAEKAAQPATPTHVTRELKKIALNRELKQVQRKLPAPQRVLSRLVHQPAVRAVSEAASKTVSRPSGLLGGGVVAFLGSSGYLYLAKHIGFAYNYLVFLLLFVGGFVVGLGLELVVWLALAHRRSED